MYIFSENEFGRYSVIEDPATGLCRIMYVCSKCKLGHTQLVGTDDELIAETLTKDFHKEHWGACDFGRTK